MGGSRGIDVTRATAGAVVALAVVAGWLLAAAWASPPALSDEERRRLAAGEIVVHETLPPGASPTARGGTAFAIVRAPADQVWRVLVDYPGHPRYYPRVVATEVLKRDAQKVLVRYQVAVGPFSFTFHMDKFPDPQRRHVEWHLADGLGHGMFRENSGYWHVDETGPDSLVTYAIAVRMLLPAFVTLGAERDSLTQTITAMRRLVEDGRGASAPAR